MLKFSNAYLRRLIAARFRSDSDLDAFCIDYFPDVYGRFTSNMDRLTKVNMLLVQADAERLGERLSMCRMPLLGDVDRGRESEQLIQGLLSLLESFGYLKKTQQLGILPNNSSDRWATW